MILEYGGVPIEDDYHLITLVSLTEVGREIPLVVFRDQKMLRATVKVGVAPSPRAAPAKAQGESSRARSAQ